MVTMRWCKVIVISDGNEAWSSLLWSSSLQSRRCNGIAYWHFSIAYRASIASPQERGRGVGQRCWWRDGAGYEERDHHHVGSVQPASCGHCSKCDTDWIVRWHYFLTSPGREIDQDFTCTNVAWCLDGWCDGRCECDVYYRELERLPCISFFVAATTLLWERMDDRGRCWCYCVWTSMDLDVWHHNPIVFCFRSFAGR